jgi:hypothetical protein
MKSERKKRRGRKAGDGVLQNIDPRSSGFEKRLQLTYGRSYRDGISGMLRWVRDLGSMIQHLKARRAALSEEQIADAEHIQVSDEELQSGSRFKTIGGKKIRVEALLYWRYKRHYESANNEIHKRLHTEMDEALVFRDSGWFQKVADAIKIEKAAHEGLPLYTLHNALLSIAGVPEIPRSASVWPEGNAGGSANQTLPYTIRELCDLLEKRGLRPGKTNVGYESWQAMVRDACRDLGYSFRPGKMGRPKTRV